jgi:hypothetical protein
MRRRMVDSMAGCAGSKRVPCAQAGDRCGPGRRSLLASRCDRTAPPDHMGDWQRSRHAGTSRRPGRKRARFAWRIARGGRGGHGRRPHPVARALRIRLPGPGSQGVAWPWPLDATPGRSWDPGRAHPDARTSTLARRCTHPDARTPMHAPRRSHPDAHTPTLTPRRSHPDAPARRPARCAYGRRRRRRAGASAWSRPEGASCANASSSAGRVAARRLDPAGPVALRPSGRS